MIRPMFKVALFLSFWAVPLALAAQSGLLLVVPSSQTIQEKAATTMFLEEAARRTTSGHAATVEPGQLLTLVAGQQAVLLANRTQVPMLLPKQLIPAWQTALKPLHPTTHPESFSIVTLPWQSGLVTVIAGNDAHGELFGAGWLLRQMSFASGSPQIPLHLRTFQSPEKPVRGYQIGYRFKNNTYDAWTLPQFEQQIRDLAIFGANTIQLIAPSSDDNTTSPLFHAPPLDTLLGISSLLQKYGLDCDLYYPEMRNDYTDPIQIAAELKDFEALVRAMPRLDALYIPGGDPGHTPPTSLFPLIAREAAILHRYHPQATVWVSAQGFDREHYEQFYALLNAHPTWLTGVFFGPQSRDSFFTQRKRIPARYTMQFYPDIGHTMHAQFPVPQWDPIFALTEGREPICPRPDAFTSIYRRFAQLHSGFITYSEGVNDDVNKILWSQLGWSSKTPVDTILRQYASFFLHREGSQNTLALHAIQGLEEDWHGPLIDNHQIPQTLQALETLDHDATPAQSKDNWRWESLLYRGIYDDYLQRKLTRERTAEATALAVLDQDRGASSSAERVASARSALAATVPTAIEQKEHDRLFSLAGQLFHDVGLQLSVKLYAASNWERGANLDRVDTPLTQTAWLYLAMDAALKQPDEPRRLVALHTITHWSGPSSGAIYDDLGDPWNEPHLVRGLGWAQDPEMYHTTNDGIADHTLADGWRLSWLDYAETFYEMPLEFHYTRLNPYRTYRVRVTYAGEDYALPLRLIANGSIEVHPARLRHANPETVEFPIPSSATASGKLTLQWIGPAGSGGSGRGRQVAEVWLLPQESNGHKSQ